MAIEDLSFSVEEWTLDGGQLIEVFARASTLPIAVPAYQAACARPKGRVMLRQRTRVIKESGARSEG